MQEIPKGAFTLALHSENLKVDFFTNQFWHIESLSFGSCGAFCKVVSTQYAPLYKYESMSKDHNKIVKCELLIHQSSQGNIEISKEWYSKPY